MNPRHLAVLALLGLTACATAPPACVKYVPVNREVAVSCVPKALGPAPADLLTPAQIAAIPDGPQRYVALAADWLNRVARMTETEPVVKGCR